MYVHVTVNQTPTFGVSKAHQQVAKLYTYSLIVSTHPQCPSTSVAHLYQCTASVDDFCPPFSQSCVKPNTIQITNYTHTHTYTSQDYSKHSSCSGVPSSWWYQHAQRIYLPFQLRVRNGVGHHKRVERLPAQRHRHHQLASSGHG